MLLRTSCKGSKLYAEYSPGVVSLGVKLFFVLIWLVVAVIFAFICSGMAARRGRNSGLWGILGFLFGFITVLLLLVAGKSPSVANNSQAMVLPRQSNLDDVAKLKKLFDDGVLTQEEFDNQKKILLGRR